MVHEEPVSVGPLRLGGSWAEPPHAAGLVLFVHGSGSSRFSPRNRFVAERLHQRGLATLLFDLLLEDEAEERARVFDIVLLATRTLQALDWAMARALQRPGAAGWRFGLFGASTGAAAALVAAAQRPDAVAAVVSRGGRPDLAGAALGHVRAPTLLLVGGLDHEVLALNRDALQRLQCEKRLDVVPGATHLFEEPGTLAQAADAAGHWFAAHLGRAAAPD